VAKGSQNYGICPKCKYVGRKDDLKPHWQAKGHCLNRVRLQLEIQLFELNGKPPGAPADPAGCTVKYFIKALKGCHTKGTVLSYVYLQGVSCLLPAAFYLLSPAFWLLSPAFWLPSPAS
jgi:hypothetical protein